MRVAVAAKIMAYRTQRESEGDRNTWSSVYFDNYVGVPANWIGNRNTMANTGTDGMIMYAPFASAVSSRKDALIEFLHKFKRQCKIVYLQDICAQCLSDKIQQSEVDKSSC